MFTHGVARESGGIALGLALVATAESRIVTFVPRREALALGLATLALSANLARAQPASGGDKEQAAKLAAEAESFGKKQQFADALKNYKEAAKLDPATAAYQCNIGMAYYALGDEARAHLYFGRCNRANGGWPANVEDVFNYVIGVLGKEDFTPLRIQGTPANAEVLINLYGEEGPLAAPLTVYVPFSNYQIQVRADGYETKTIQVEANNRTEKTVSYDLKEAVGGAVTEPTGPRTGGAVTTEGDVDKQVDSGGRKKWPLVLAGGGVVAAIGGFVAFRAAKNKQEELCSLTETGKCEAPVSVELDPDGRSEG
ncbi:MAG TPA: tetratricopeptide repeat protein, partial [Kofleriaceae bacterium]